MAIYEIYSIFQMAARTFDVCMCDRVLIFQEIKKLQIERNGEVVNFDNAIPIITERMNRTDLFRSNMTDK